MSCFLSSSTMCSMIGRLKSGIIGLGMLPVRGWMRVPKPPAMMTAFIGAYLHGEPFGCPALNSPGTATGYRSLPVTTSGCVPVGRAIQLAVSHTRARGGHVVGGRDTSPVADLFPFTQFRFFPVLAVQ